MTQEEIPYFVNSELVLIIIISNFPREIQTKEEDIVNLLNIFYHHLKLCMKCTAKNPGIWDFTKVQDGCLHQFNMWNYFGLEINHFGIKNVNSDLKLGLSHQSRDWSPKFATGLNMMIGCSSKSIWVTRLLFCQNDSPMWGNHFGKRTVWSLIYFLN